jgi:cobalt/nickel transport protein
MRQIGIALFAFVLAASTSFAHYNMLLPDKPWANKGDKVTFTYQFGHPFEHEVFDAPEPKAVIVILPDDKTQKIEKFTKLSVPGADGKKVTAFSFVYEPAMRGDHTVVLQTPPFWMEESKEYWQDTVKVVLHVQTQKNWDAFLPPKLLGNQLRMTPETRPYGLWPGMIFQASVWWGREVPQPRTEIEIERYNAQPVKAPPPDELITFKTRTDPNGVFTFAFPDPGWWCMTAGYQEIGRGWVAAGKKGPLRERTTLWVHVDEKK